MFNVTPKPGLQNVTDMTENWQVGVKILGEHAILQNKAFFLGSYIYEHSIQVGTKERTE